MRLRILPLVIVVAFAMILVKGFDMARKEFAIKDGKLVAKFEKLAAEGEAAPAENTGEGAADGSENVDNSAPVVAKGEEPVPSPGYAPPLKQLDVTNMSDMEKNLLENLAKRRKELEDWAASISMKENILNATEKKINRKMEELNKLQTDVNAILQQYNEKEDRKVRRLVKIYENMKPKDAANIFEGMEIDILLEVVDGMKEDKAAKILSKLSAAKAKEITVRLAEQKRLAVN